MSQPVLDAEHEDRKCMRLVIDQAWLTGVKADAERVKEKYARYGNLPPYNDTLRLAETLKTLVEMVEKVQAVTAMEVPSGS